MPFVLGRQLGTELCQAMGIKPDRVKAITILMPIDDIAVAEVEYYPEPDELKGVFERYRFERLPEPQV